MKQRNTKHFKKMLACLLILVLTFCNAAFMRVDVTAASPKGFYVSGTSVKDANGNDFVMRGINIPHAWFQQYTEMTMEAIANLGCNSVRVVCANGDRWNETTEDELEEIISMCRQNRMVCILEVHDATGKEDLESLEACAKYWISKKDVLTKNQDIVIVNIANEWFGSWEGAKWAKGYETVIPMMREGGITNLIMVDCAGWGQYPRCIKDYGKEVFASDPMKNTMFSMHLYEYAGGTADMVKTNLDNALSIGVPVCVGEFGQRHTDGDVDEETILSYCEENAIGHLAWSWKGNNAPVDFLDLTNTWDGSDLTEWGDRLFNGKNGIKETAKTCTVFGNAPVQPVEPEEKDDSISHKFAPSSPKHHYFTKEQTALLSEENAVIEVTTTTKIEQSGWLNISLVGDSQGKKADVMYKAKAGTKVLSVKAADFFKNELGLNGKVSFENFHVYTWNETVIEEINIKTKGTATQPTEEPKTEIPTEIPSETVVATVDPTVEPTEEVTPTVVPTEVPSTEVPSTEAPSTEVPSTEAPSTEAPSTEAPVESGLKCEYSVNDWGSGFQVLIKIKNTGSKVNSWTLKVSKKDIVFDNSWCVDVKEVGDYYVITPMSWNASLDKGASTDFGIQGGAGGIKTSNIKFELN